jgi:hypothetical protein
MAKRIIYVRNNEALIKIEGVAGTQTISLATDLLGANEVLNGQTPTVNFAGMVWTSGPTGFATIVRNGVTIASAIGCGSLSPNNGFQFDNGGNTNDIVVTTTGADDMQIWIKLHKIAGYQTKIQPEQYGSYDNPNSATS